MEDQININEAMNNILQDAHLNASTVRTLNGTLAHLQTSLKDLYDKQVLDYVDCGEEIAKLDKIQYALVDQIEIQEKRGKFLDNRIKVIAIAKKAMDGEVQIIQTTSSIKPINAEID